jgi:hypothetical protein
MGCWLWFVQEQIKVIIIVLRAERLLVGNLTPLECLMETVELWKNEFAVAVVLGVCGLRLRVCVSVGSTTAACTGRQRGLCCCWLASAT